MKRIDMVRRGTEKLFLAENSIEQAIRDVAGLASDLSDMRLNSSLSVMHGQDAFDGLASVMTILAKARGEIITVHKALDEVKTDIGCGARMDGIGVNKPNPQPVPAVVSLRDVA